MSLNIALKGFLKPGDHVVTTALEHNSLLRPLHGLSNRSDVRYSLVECSPEGVLNLEELESVLKHNRTKLIAVVHASNVTGAVLPIRQISAVAAHYGVALLVDAAQSVGAFPFSIADWPRIDFLAFSGHKSLLGPQGTGALYVSEEVELEPLCEGGTGSRSESIDQPSLLPDQLESGTANAAGVAGLAASTRFLLSVGVEAVHDHECHLADHLIAGISQIPGIKVYGQGANARTGVVSFTVQGWDPGEVSFVLDEEFGIMSRPGLHCTPFAHRVLGTFPAGTVRLSVGYFNTLQEIEFTIQALEDIASRQRKA
jgi:cysteine desulfurase family protein